MTKHNVTVKYYNNIKHQQKKTTYNLRQKNQNFQQHKNGIKKTIIKIRTNGKKKSCPLLSILLFPSKNSNRFRGITVIFIIKSLVRQSKN